MTDTLGDALPRETAVGDGEVASLAESIALLGLQQNLIGYVEDGVMRVAGGGLRLRALQRLAAESHIQGAPRRARAQRGAP